LRGLLLELPAQDAVVVVDAGALLRFDSAALAVLLELRRQTEALEALEAEKDRLAEEMVQLREEDFEARALLAQSYFVDVDATSHTLNKKIREAQVEQYNFIVVVGAEEEAHHFDVDDGETEKLVRQECAPPARGGRGHWVWLPLQAAPLIRCC
jgi:hypothetical protein